MLGPDRLKHSGNLIRFLKLLVRKERQRAEANPLDDRNLTLGVVEPGQTSKEARQQILLFFNDLEALLEHLHITRLAATFEAEAKARLATIIGESRTAIKKTRKHRGSWPERLVRDLKSVEGLRDIEELLGNDAGLKPVRDCRNNFSHGGPLNQPPLIQDDEALTLLIQVLADIK